MMRGLGCVGYRNLHFLDEKHKEKGRKRKEEGDALQMRMAQQCVRRGPGITAWRSETARS